MIGGNLSWETMVWKRKRIRRVEAKRRNAYQRGYTKQWAASSRDYRRENPLCVLCYARGFTTAAAVTDHIIPHRGDPRLFWDTANWQSLCRSCHDRDKARVEARYAGPAVKAAWQEVLLQARLERRGGG